VSSYFLFTCTWTFPGGFLTFKLNLSHSRPATSAVTVGVTRNVVDSLRDRRLYRGFTNSENAEHDIWARYLTQWHDDKGLRYGI